MMEVQQLSTREGGQQGVLPPQEEQRRPLAELEKAIVCSPHVILGALTKVTLFFSEDFSIPSTGSRGQAAHPQHFLLCLAGPVA